MVNLLNNDIELIKKYVSEDKQKQALKRLEDGEPVQYIIGNVEFYNSIIDVNKNVLIPRFETELLVAKTIKYLKEMFNKKIDIVDLGTGSGCIAISLKKAIDCNVTTLDISKEALEVAKSNAIKNNVDIDFQEYDITKLYNKIFDCIISNPPYIAKDAYIEQKVLDNEPIIALFADDNGLYFYKKILEYSSKMLNKKSLIAFEIGDNQKELLKDYLNNNYKDINYRFEKDLTDRYRYLFIFNE